MMMIIIILLYLRIFIRKAAASANRHYCIFFFLFALRFWVFLCDRHEWVLISKCMYYSTWASYEQANYTLWNESKAVVVDAGDDDDEDDVVRGGGCSTGKYTRSYIKLRQWVGHFKDPRPSFCLLAYSSLSIYFYYYFIKQDERERSTTCDFSLLFLYIWVHVLKGQNIEKEPKNL